MSVVYSTGGNLILTLGPLPPVAPETVVRVVAAACAGRVVSGIVATHVASSGPHKAVRISPSMASQSMSTVSTRAL